MAWTAPKDWQVGSPLTSAELDEQLSANMLETAPAKAEAAGDIFVATGANAIKRLALGTATHLLRANAAGDDVEYVDPASALKVARVVAAGELSSGAASIVIQNYGTFRRLRLEVYNAGGTGSVITVRFNNDGTGNDYNIARQMLNGTFSDPAATTSWAASGGASVVAFSLWMDILSKGSSGFYAAVHSNLVGLSGDTDVCEAWGQYMDSGSPGAAQAYITRIDLLGSSGAFGAGTHYVLYGQDDVTP